MQTVTEACGVFPAGEIFAEIAEAETVMDAAVQDPAGQIVMFGEDHVGAFTACGKSRGHSRGAGSCYEDVTGEFFHGILHTVSSFIVG